MHRNATYITIPCNQLSGSTELPMPNSGVNILIDSTELNMAAVVQFVQTHQCQLIYSLNGTVVTQAGFENLWPRIYLLHTLCDSFMPNRGIIPVFTNEAVPVDRLRQLKGYLEQQGTSTIDFTFFAAANTAYQLQAPLLFLPAQQLASFNKADFDQLINQPIHKILIGSDAITPANEWFTLLHNTVALSAEAGWEKYKTALWQERAKLYLSFIALGKKVGEQEYHEIKNWYHNEYEVLPLWFKRVGHIVKVLTGKKSFKSLFPDKVKKKKN
jgi:hypothetical protein